MNIKTKILIGVLSVLIVLIGGLWAWKEITEKSSVLKPPEAHYYFICPDGSHHGPGLPSEGVLEWCERYGYVAPEEVTIATDRTEYGRGENVKIVVENNSDALIWYAGSLDGCAYSFWEIEKFEDNRWIEIKLPEVMITCEALNYDFTQLEPGGKLEDVWNGYVSTQNLQGEGIASTGRYRIVFYYSPEEISTRSQYLTTRIQTYSNEFRIK